MRRAPAGATEWSSRDFRSPGRGLDQLFATNRWFAPPANVQCPFGTSRSLSSTNSRYVMRSRRFEVEGFAKHVRKPPFLNPTRAATLTRAFPARGRADVERSPRHPARY